MTPQGHRIRTVAPEANPTNPGWYPDPNGLSALRWWDGRIWHEDTLESLPAWEGVPGRWELWEATDVVEREGVHTTAILSPLMPSYDEAIVGMTHTWTVEASGMEEARTLVFNHLHPDLSMPVSEE